MDIIIIILGQMLVYAPPIFITAVGACFTEITGVINLGLEGMMLSGAFTAAVVGYMSGNAYIGIAAGAIVGGLLALVHAFICITLKGNQTVSGVAINIASAAITAYLVKLIFGVAGATKTLTHQPNKILIMVLIYLIAISANFLMYKTVLGLRMRAVGEYPLAADTVGINVKKIRYIGVILSGVFAGLGGAYLSTVILSSFSTDMTAGRGYMAMAAMIFGKWRPWAAILASFLFVFGISLEAQLSSLPALSMIPTQFFQMIPYLLTLLALVGVVGKIKAPSSSGIAYEKN